MAVVRMQCIDFPHRNRLFRTLVDMMRHDGLWMFVRGLPAIFFGTLCLGGGIFASTMLRKLIEYQEVTRYRDINNDDGWKNITKVDIIKPELTLTEKMQSKVWVLPVVMGAFISHPFQVIGTNVIYSRFKIASKNANRFRNSVVAAKEIYRLYGSAGFYRGFV